jgi:hypothetical protein
VELHGLKPVGVLPMLFSRIPLPPGEILPCWIEFRCFRIYGGRELRKPPEVKKSPGGFRLDISGNLFSSLIPEEGNFALVSLSSS